ncbi:hypothetical protein ES702_02986 [subsurface metagenome]
MSKVKDKNETWSLEGCKSPKKLIYSDFLEKIKELCIEGNLNDGAHHKDWYFEQILIKLGYNLPKLKKDIENEGYEWNDGIPP